jgi:limonene-1,2-epoxide hydrolase
MPTPLEIVRGFTNAFNKRDQDSFLALLTADVEVRNPLGNSTTGHEAAKQFLAANTHLGVYVEPDGPERVDGNHVALPVHMRMGDGTELHPAGVFDIRDDKIARFSVVMDRAAAGL